MLHRVGKLQCLLSCIWADSIFRNMPSFCSDAIIENMSPLIRLLLKAIVHISNWGRYFTVLFRNRSIDKPKHTLLLHVLTKLALFANQVCSSMVSSKGALSGYRHVFLVWMIYALIMVLCGPLLVHVGLQCFGLI